MWKTALIVMLLILSSCRGMLPEMQGKVKIWNGTPEKGAICRIVDRDDPESMICIDAYDDIFKKYACLTWDDVSIWAEYIEALKNRCKKWKK